MEPLLLVLLALHRCIMMKTIFLILALLILHLDTMDQGVRLRIQPP